MNKKTTAYVIIGILVMVGAYLLFWPKAAVQKDGIPVLFTRYDCPHCKIVEEYVSSTPSIYTAKIVNKEIHDSTNLVSLAKTARECSIPEAEIGVPLLFDGGKCYVGDKEIIDRIKSQQ